MYEYVLILECNSWTYALDIWTETGYIRVTIDLVLWLINSHS